MKLKLMNYLSALLVVSLLFTACKKENDPPQTPAPDVEIGMHSDDEAMVSEEIDAIAVEANSLMEADASFSGDASVVEEIICDATVVVDRESDPMTITVTFNGADCSVERSRTGVVVFSMAKGTQWKYAGAAIHVDFQDVKITRKSDSKSITLNGSQVYTNVSGGLVYQAASLGEIIHQITSNDLSIKFDDETARIWNVARQKTFTYSNGLVVSVTGIHEEDNETNIAEWGTNRFGNSFTTSTPTPVVFKQDCDFRVTGGEVKHKTEVFTATVMFGLDASGTTTTCPGSGHYYYKLVWTKNSTNNSFTVILPY